MMSFLRDRKASFQTEMIGIFFLAVEIPFCLMELMTVDE